MLKQNAILTVIMYLAAVAPAFAADVASGDKSASFKGKLGLQLYSLRAQFAKDVPGTLDKVRDMGFKYVESAGTYGEKPGNFKKDLNSRGLTAVSAHFPFEKFRDDVESVAKEAKAL